MYWDQCGQKVPKLSSELAGCNSYCRVYKQKDVNTQWSNYILSLSWVMCFRLLCAKWDSHIYFLFFCNAFNQVRMPAQGTLVKMAVSVKSLVLTVGIHLNVYVQDAGLAISVLNVSILVSHKELIFRQPCLIVTWVDQNKISLDLVSLWLAQKMQSCIGLMTCAALWSIQLTLWIGLEVHTE